MNIECIFLFYLTYKKKYVYHLLLNVFKYLMHTIIPIKQNESS